ncbi:MAG: hypothetical protein EAZ41_08155 [Sphingobacteriia bacterium]|nr:MAG: hypothetical protein EAZ41_08155 [Sphingobacteriia bacterium]
MGYSALAQLSSPTKVKTVVFKDGKRVYVRWFLSDAKQWRAANEKGYFVERSVKGTNNFQRLNTAPVRPITEQQALKYIKESDEFALHSILKAKPDPTKPAELEADKGIYAMFILLSSYAPSNAYLSASGFIDSTTVTGINYMYRVVVNGIPVNNQDITTAEVSGNSKKGSMPAINAAFGDKIAKLSWNVDSIKQEYPVVLLERSTDSVNYARITGRPLITTLEQEGVDNSDSTKGLMGYRDESVVNRTTYYYRLRGINIFGVLSDPSNVVSGRPEPAFASRPRILSVDTIANRFALSWSIVDSLKSLVSSYEIWTSETSEDSTFTKLTQFAAKRGPGVMQTTFSFQPKGTNYFVIKAILKKDKSAIASVPYLYLLKDSIPPLPPTGLVGRIDTAGNVLINWTANTEQDLNGYKVYKSAVGPDSKTVIPLQAEPLTTTEFKEKVLVKQLNRDIYYTVTALDNKFNESNYANFVLVQRPDVIAPAPPVLRTVQMQPDGKSIAIQWSKSFSKDVRDYLIERRLNSDSLETEWKQIFKARGSDTVYTDVAIQQYTSYDYRLRAVDSSDLKSEVSLTLSFIAKKQVQKVKTITNLNAYISREKKYIELNWNLNNSDIVEVVIYRAENRNESQVSLIATLPASRKIYDDENIKENTLYTYYLKAVFKTGGASELQKIDVEF